MNIEQIRAEKALLETARTELHEKQRSVNAQLEALIEQEVELVHGVRVGSVVACKGKDYRVTRIEDASWRSKPWLRGVPRRKDGTFGTAERVLFNGWEIVKP